MALLAKDMAEVKCMLRGDASASVRTQPTLPGTLASSSAPTSKKAEPPAAVMRGFTSEVKRILLKNPDVVVLGQNRKRKEDDDTAFFFFSTNEIVDGGNMAKAILKDILPAEYAAEIYETTCPEHGVSSNV